MKINHIGMQLIFVSLLGAIFTAGAHKGATGIVKQRMDVMSEMGDDMKIIGDMVKGKTAYDLDAARRSIANLSEYAPKLVEQFPDTPESRNFKMSEALPQIWKSKEDFDGLASLLQTRIEELKIIAGAELNKPKLRIAFIRTVKACSSCHDDYRKPKD